PESQQVIIDITFNKTIETMVGLGNDDVLIDSQIATIEHCRDAAKGFSVGQTLIGTGISLIMYFVFALILAAILKQGRPGFLNIPNTSSDDSEVSSQENI